MNKIKVKIKKLEKEKIRLRKESKCLEEKYAYELEKATEVEDIIYNNDLKISTLTKRIKQLKK